MKKLLPFFILTAVLLSSGCDRMIWDFITPNVSILVQNADGDNLLDPAFESNILDDEIYAEYNGDIYPLANHTRESYPRWEGLRAGIDEWNRSSPITLLFGEFSPSRGDNGYHGETFTVYWGDGTKDEITFDLYVTGTNRKPDVKKRLWINGKQVSKNSLTAKIVR